MKAREKFLLVAGLAMMLVAAGCLLYLKSRQSLGEPGVKTQARPDSVRLDISIPTNVPGYVAEPKDKESRKVEEMLPEDTSITTVSYEEPGLPPIIATVVLMGTDRTSIHNPEFCLPGAGVTIDWSRSGLETVPLDRPHPLDLQVMRIHGAGQREVNGKAVDFSAVYVYWFVTEDAVTAERWQFMKWMADSLITKGVLQRWAYVSYLTYCPVGQEAETFGRIKKLINATAPEFQLAWPAVASQPE
jgi:hypothetical protein